MSSPTITPELSSQLSRRLSCSRCAGNALLAVGQYIGPNRRFICNPCFENFLNRELSWTALARSSN